MLIFLVIDDETCLDFKRVFDEMGCPPLLVDALTLRRTSWRMEEIASLIGNHLNEASRRELSLPIASLIFPSDTAHAYSLAVLISQQSPTIRSYREIDVSGVFGADGLGY